MAIPALAYRSKAHTIPLADQSASFDTGPCPYSGRTVFYKFHKNPFVLSRNAVPYRRKRTTGFTLLEVLVALVIVATALGASLRAVGSLTQNSSGLRAATMASWSAENRLNQIRLGHEWPAIGNRSFNCAQGELQLRCEEHVSGTPNPYFRQVEVSVFDAGQSRIVKLTQVVPNVR